MTAAPYLAPSDEAEWEGLERVWTGVRQYPPRRDRSSWWLVLAGIVLVVIAIGVKL